jgi:DNA-binding response OmpR family regulator
MKPSRNGVVLVVGDQETTLNSIADILRLEGYIVHSVPSGEDALNFLTDEQVDLIITDLKLPGIDGLEILRDLYRQDLDTKTIILTAVGSLESAVEALRYHAFDYLIQPVSTSQLLESVQRALDHRKALLQKQILMDEMEAALRHLLEAGYESFMEGIQPEGARVVYLGNDVMVNFDRRELWGGPPGNNDQRVHLTSAESKLLNVLLERGGEVLTHRELVMMVQGYEVSDWEAPEVLRPLVSRLRQKLANFPGGEHWILNVRGKGYLFERRGTKG